MSANAGSHGDPTKEDKGEKKRGRPPGSKNKPIPVLTPSEVSLPPSPTKSNPRAKSASPKRGKFFADARTDASIDLEYLKSCNPSVWPHKPGENIPPKSKSLYDKLDDVPLGCIPAELEVRLSINVLNPVDAMNRYGD